MGVRRETVWGEGGKDRCRPLTASSWRMCSIVASRARVPLVASSSTAFTVLSSDVTLVTMTCRETRQRVSLNLGS